MAVETNHSAKDFGAQKVAAVYAKAFLGAAESAGKTDALVAELDALVRDVLEKYPDFQRVLASELISAEEKERILDRVLANRVSSDLLVFLKVVARHGRLDCLRPIRDQVLHMQNQMRGRLEVSVRTPRPLDEAMKAELSTTIRRMFQAEAVLTAVTDPSLLGGLVLRVGDTVYDGSVATRLAQLRSDMIEKTVQRIETSRELEKAWELP
jgi:F-type H+-transporting ATPase subunit delta